MARYRGCSCNGTRGRTSAYFGEAVHEPIEDRIAKGGVANQVVPVVDRHLAGDQRGPSSRAVFHGLRLCSESEQIPNHESRSMVRRVDRVVRRSTGRPRSVAEHPVEPRRRAVPRRRGRASARPCSEIDRRMDRTRPDRAGLGRSVLPCLARRSGGRAALPFRRGRVRNSALKRRS